MTRTELIATLKALRETGVTVPALNSKTTVLQEWYDKYTYSLEVEARQQAALEECEELEAGEVAPQADMENCDDLTNLACSLTSEIDSNPLWDGRACELTCEVPNIETYRYYVHTDRGMIPVESIADSEETFANSGIFDNCVNVGRWDNGNIKSFNSETLWCDLPNTRAQNNTEVVHIEMPEGTYKVLIEFKNDEYVASSGNGYGYGENESKAITALFESDSELEIINHTEVVQPEIKHGQVGVIIALMFIEFIKLTAVVTSFTIAFTYSLIRRTAINHALIYDSFKSAVNVARRTLQTA